MRREIVHWIIVGIGLVLYVAAGASLRAAQMDFIRGPIEMVDEDGKVVKKDYSAPYHWAAFQLIGDYR